MKLSSAIYEMVLYDFLKKDYKVITPGVSYSFLYIFHSDTPNTVVSPGSLPLGTFGERDVCASTMEIAY